METRETIASLVNRTGVIISVTAYAELLRVREEENSWIEQRTQAIRENFYSLLDQRKSA